MIDIGSIAYGPELKRKPIMQDLERLSQALRGPAIEDPVLEIAFIIPGSLGQADFQGFQVKSRRDRRRSPLIFVAVPQAVVDDDQPLVALFELAREAAAIALKSGRITVVDHGLALEGLARAAGSLGVVDWDRQTNDAPPDTGQVGSSPARPAEPGIEVVLQLDDPAATDAAFRLEAALNDLLVSKQLGYVDGNDVDERHFTIYAFGPDGAALESAVIEVLRAHWDGRAGALHVLDAEGRELSKTSIQ